MPHYTDKDMTYEEFSKLLKDRYEKGESTDDYSYKSNITIEELKTRYITGVNLGLIKMSFEDYLDMNTEELEQEPVIGRRYFPLDIINGEMSLYLKHPNTGIPIQIGKMSSDLRDIDLRENLDKKIDFLTEHLRDIYLVNDEGESVLVFKKQEGYVLLPEVTKMCQELYIDTPDEERKLIGYISWEGSIWILTEETKENQSND